MAIAQQLLSTGRGVNGSAFLVSGMNSGDASMFIDDRAYFSAMNVVNRGGIVQSRPGYRCLFTLPDGNLQGLCYYKPLKASPYLVFAVDGIIYASKYPFRRYDFLPGIQFYKSAKQIYWCVAIKSADQAADGTITVIDPVRVLMMQDGAYSPAAYWDGASTSRQLNPGDDETPMGGPMVWSGDRLWVAKDNQIFASDISDPLKFTEITYLAEGGSFTMQEDVTALAEIPGIVPPQIAAFTIERCDTFQSGIRDRSTWKGLANPPFQSVLFPNVGCVSQRSIMSQNGLLWWMTNTGITSFNAAQQTRVTSIQSPQDAEMANSKGNLSPNIRYVCCASIENYGLFSMPSGHKKNRHTWVMDKAILAGLNKDSASAWNSVWTGTYPLEWSGGDCAGAERIFHVSNDEDGTNRLWEAFTADRLDNGLPITSYIETKTHSDFSPKATGLDLKKFIFAEVTFTEIFGNVSAAVYWAGVRGVYRKIAEYNFVSTLGELKEGVDVTLGTPIFGNRPQTRVVRTPEFNPDKLIGDNQTSCGVESIFRDHIDVGFSLLIVWSGRAAVSNYRIFADPVEERGSGGCVASEVGKTNVVTDKFDDNTLTQVA